MTRELTKESLEAYLKEIRKSSPDEIEQISTRLREGDIDVETSLKEIGRVATRIHLVNEIAEEFNLDVKIQK